MQRLAATTMVRPSRHLAALLGRCVLDTGPAATPCVSRGVGLRRSQSLSAAPPGLPSLGQALGASFASCAFSKVRRRAARSSSAARLDREGPQRRAASSASSRHSLKVMTLNVQFYSQMCRVLAELGNLEVKYGPFKQTAMATSTEGRSLEQLAAELPQLSEGDAGFAAYRALPCVRRNLNAIAEFLRFHAPDVVALQEGTKGMDISVTDPGYKLEVVSTADAELHCVTKGVLVNQVLLNRANEAVSLEDTWQLLTKEGGEGGQSEYTDTVEGDRSVPRSAAGARLIAHGRRLDVVSIHLTGGRFDDQHWRQYRTQRSDEIKRVIDQRYSSEVPMLLLGDFNAPSTPEELRESYARQLGAETPEEIEHWKEYMVGVHAELKKLGWRAAYTKEDLPRVTSVFGCSVDWAYVSPNWPASWEIGRPQVPDIIHASSEAWAEYPAGGSLRLSLSDHNPVLLELSLD